MQEYEPTTRVRIEGKIRNLDGALDDPTQLIFSILEPDGTETDYTWGVDDELEQVSTGIFRVEWDADQAGLHKYRWQANGAIQVAFGGAFNIKERSF